MTREAMKMKAISEITSYEDVVVWCRDFFAVTGSTYFYMSEYQRILLMAFVGLLYDWFSVANMEIDSIITLLSMAEVHEWDPEYLSPLDLIFEQISSGRRLKRAPAFTDKDTGGIDSEWVWEPSFFKRNSDGVIPAERGGLYPDEDFALGCYHAFRQLPSYERVRITSNLLLRVYDFKYAPVDTDTKEDETQHNPQPEVRKHRLFGFLRRADR